MRKASLSRSCAALAAVTSLALAVTGCGGTTKEDVRNEGKRPPPRARPTRTRPPGRA